MKRSRSERIIAYLLVSRDNRRSILTVIREAVFVFHFVENVLLNRTTIVAIEELIGGIEQFLIVFFVHEDIVQIRDHQRGGVGVGMGLFEAERIFRRGTMEVVEDVAQMSVHGEDTLGGLRRTSQWIGILFGFTIGDRGGEVLVRGLTRREEKELIAHRVQIDFPEIFVVADLSQSRARIVSGCDARFQRTLVPVGVVNRMRMIGAQMLRIDGRN